MSNEDTTHFGFKQVAEPLKAREVRRVFDSVAGRYDLMNDLMSLGVHRAWKRFAVATSGVREGHRVLDLAGGTGDLAALVCERVRRSGTVVLCDINHAMLDHGRRRLLDRGHAGNLLYTQADAERLPFPDDTFDRVTMAFGLRNVTHKELALAEIARVLRPGGGALVLEFSPRVLPLLRPLYEVYSFRVLPWLGARVAGDAESYRYLAESIRMHPEPEALEEMMREAGLDLCSYSTMSGGVVAVHRGFKL